MRIKDSSLSSHGLGSNETQDGTDNANADKDNAVILR